MEKALSARQVSAESGVSYGQVLAAIRGGTLKARKIKGAYSVKPKEADRFTREDAPGLLAAADAFVSAKQAATGLDVDHKDVISLIHAKSLQAEKVRGRYRIAKPVFERFRRNHAANLGEAAEGIHFPILAGVDAGPAEREGPPGNAPAGRGVPGRPGGIR